MKKIFILTGEPSGDRLASKVISKLKSTKSDIAYLSVGGEYLKGLGIKTLYDFNAINITLGLPFIRISPDHGPNNKMIGQKRSDPSSFREALIFLRKINGN